MRAIRGVFGITLLCGVATLIPQYFVAINLGAELPAFAGSVVSLILVALAGGARNGKSDVQWRAENINKTQSEPYSPAVLLRTCSIYILMFVFILLCSPLFPGIKSVVAQIASVLRFPMGNGEALVLKVEWFGITPSEYSESPRII